MDNVLVYYTKRHIGYGNRRYLNPSTQEVPNKKTSVIFNYDYARLSKTVIVCEGMFDAMTIGSSAIAIMGKTISEDQYNIISNNWNNIILAFDPDAWRENIELYKRFKSSGKSVKILHIDGSKDLNELGKEKAIELLMNIENSKFTLSDLLRYRIRAFIPSIRKF